MFQPLNNTCDNGNAYNNHTRQLVPLPTTSGIRGNTSKESKGPCKDPEYKELEPEIHNNMETPQQRSDNPYSYSKIQNYTKSESADTSSMNTKHAQHDKQSNKNDSDIPQTNEIYYSTADEVSRFQPTPSATSNNTDRSLNNIYSAVSDRQIPAEGAQSCSSANENGETKHDTVNYYSLPIDDTPEVPPEILQQYGKVNKVKST